MSPRILVWFWSGGGGGSAFAVRLAERLRERFGADAISISLRGDDPLIARAWAAGLDVKAADIVSDRRRPLSSLLGLAEASRTIAAHASGADLVVAAMNFATLAPLVWTLNKPLVYCAHDPAPHPGDYAVLAQRVTQALIMARAARVVALSDFAGSMLRRDSVVGEKLHVAPLSSVFKPEDAPRELGSPVRFLCLGRMMAYKGLDILADALPSLASRQDWRLTIAGRGPALDAGMAARFRLPQVEAVRDEWLEEGEIEDLLRSHDVLVAPYVSATQSGVVAQALACGMPCVVTPVGALGEQIEHGRAGWVASAAEASELARALQSVLDHPESIAVKAAGARAVAREAWQADSWGWLGHNVAS